MELRQLRYFATVAHELNFTRAAAKLRVAQPALSRQIKQLEEELGVQLLVRDNRKVELTEPGEKFLEEARIILQQTQKACEVVRHADAAGNLNIAYVWGLFHSLLPGILQKFRREHPATGINLLDLPAAQQAQALQEGSIDAGFIGFLHEAERAGLQKRAIGRCSFRAVLPSGHLLASKSKVDLRWLSSELFLLISEEHFPGASAIMIRAVAEAGFKPRTLQTPERGHTILSLVAAGCGVALLPEPLNLLPHEGVSFLPLTNPVTAELYVAWKEPGSKIVENFLSAVPSL